MVKQVRIVEDNSSYAMDWSNWVRSNPDRFSEVDPHNVGSIDREMVRTGKSEDEIRKERLERYWALNAEWRTEWESKKAIRVQEGLVRNNSLDSICSVYQRADRILTNTSVSVLITEDGEMTSPAWNDGKDITFNGKIIKDLSEETIASLHGLNYHELAHLFFTPRAGSTLGKWVRETHKPIKTHTYELPDGSTSSMTWAEDATPVDPMRQVAFNILEDIRAEYYLLLKYPSVRPFLTATLGQYLVDNDKTTMANNFILLAGRKYFSRQARAVSANLYASVHGEDKARRVYEISTEYRTLVFPRQYDRAQELIQEFISLVPEDTDTPSGCAHRPVMRNGRAQSEKEQDALRGQDGDNENLSDLLGEEGRGAGTGDVETGEINPETASFHETSEELRDQIQQAVDRAKSDKTYRNKVRETSRTIAKSNSVKTVLTKSKSGTVEPTQSDIRTSRIFGQELERLRIDSDPAWDLEKPTGKLNVRRAMNADVNEINKLFDRWETGNEDYDIEACVLIDRSGSMYSEIGSACRSAWIIKRAIERINGKVSVMTFTDYSRSLYTADEKALASSIRMVESGGGTDPEMALVESERIMSQSKANTKLVFLLTDGAFNGGVSDDTIKRLNASGVYTSIVFLGSDDYISSMTPETVAELSHSAKDFRAISKPIDLVKVAKDVVRHNLRGGRRG